MTAEEWETSADWRAMLEAAKRRLRRRPAAGGAARRFAGHCAAEAILGIEPFPSTYAALQRLEKVLATPSGADGLGEAQEMAQAAEAEAFADPDTLREWRAASAVLAATRDDPWQAAEEAADFFTVDTDNDPAAAAALRELFGNPFRPVRLPRGWRGLQSGFLVRLAQQAHAERRFDGLLVLADALEDAGCADEYLIGHCRSENAHMHGCWAIELLRGEG